MKVKVSTDAWSTCKAKGYGTSGTLLFNFAQRRALIAPNDRLETTAMENGQSLWTLAIDNSSRKA